MVPAPGSGSPSRALFTYGFPYGEYATCFATKSGGVFTSYTSGSAMYITNEDNFQMGCYYFLANNPGSFGSLGGSTLQATWSGLWHSFIKVTFEYRYAYFQ
jgi:hypothetical protein